MTNWLERPNFLSILILAAILLLAGGYGVITYTQRPEMERFSVDEDYPFPYDFNRADQVTRLPEDLEEISGLALWREPNELLAVQDEDGKLFILNAETGKISEEFKFGKDRDYEGITRLGDTIYVLEADGDIHRLYYQAGKEEYDSEKLETLFSYRNDVEGICYDERTHALLLAPKEQELNPGETDDSRRGIYAYDLATGAMNAQPAFYVDEFEVGELVYGTQKKYTIKPSGVAVHPLTGEIFILSSVGNILVVVDRESNLKHVELLEKKTFRQPEGITFNARGDLFISSEGRGGKAIVATLRIREKQRSEPTDTTNQ